MLKSESQKHAVMAWLGDKPIYADEVRQLADVASKRQPQTWKPANVAAQKLFRCVECLRDLELLLRTGGRLKNKAKQRRNLKIMHTPLHSLVEAVRDLANDLENNPETFQRLPTGARELVPQIRSQLLSISKIGKGTLLSATRNKISAHIDTELSAEEMRLLLSQADPAQMGLWLHTCISSLTDFCKLPVYFWSSESDDPGNIRILFVEPFVVTLGMDSSGRVNGIIDVHMIPKPPRHDVFKLMMRVVKHSEWMFGPRDSRIVNFTEDMPMDSWAKSLKCLPPISGLAAKDDGCSVVPRISTEKGSFLLIPASAPFLVNGAAQQVIKPEDLDKWQ